MILQQIMASQNGSSEYSDLTDVGLKIKAGIDTVILSYLWFNAYKSSDFPTIVNDKKYFFLYGTNHDIGDGGIWWGKGDFLDLSDFNEVGLIWEGYQTETPYLMTIPEVTDNEKVHLFFHNHGDDPANPLSIQNTRMFSTAGGVLSDDIWTDRGYPLDFEVGENHLGYLKMFKTNYGEYRSIHLSQGGTPAQYKFSIFNPLDRTFTRGDIYNLTLGIENNNQLKASFGTHFNKYGIDWFLGTVEPIDSSPIPGAENKQLILAKSQNNFQVYEQVALLNYGNVTRNYEAHIEGDFAHLYWQNNDDGLDDSIYYGKYDLKNLLNYL